MWNWTCFLTIPENWIGFGIETWRFLHAENLYNDKRLKYAAKAANVLCSNGLKRIGT